MNRIGTRTEVGHIIRAEWQPGDFLGRRCVSVDVVDDTGITHIPTGWFISSDPYLAIGGLLDNRWVTQLRPDTPENRRHYLGDPTIPDHPDNLVGTPEQATLI